MLLLTSGGDRTQDALSLNPANKQASTGARLVGARLAIECARELTCLTVAQAQLRHADPRITLGIYGHVIGDAHREAVDKVASILASNGLNQKPQTEVIQ